MAKNTKQRSTANSQLALERRSMIGPKMNFASAEAYKLLRTNVMFSFPDAGEHRVLGVTSSFRGEGKSLTSINLAYTFAETGKKILMIEGDMRLPTASGRLNLSAKPGLSNVLVGTDAFNHCVQKYTAMDKDRAVSFDVLVSGDIPPNPAELLGADRAANFLQALRKNYDYVILDLPPVTAVTDAVIASRLVDGMVVVVRADHAVRGAVAETMRQLSLADAHVLGFVFNGAGTGEGGYYKKGYYRRSSYYSSYYNSNKSGKR